MSLVKVTKSRKQVQKRVLAPVSIGSTQRAFAQRRSKAGASKASLSAQSVRTIRHREMVTNLVAFNQSGLASFGIMFNDTVNPAYPVTMPWLSAVAARFEHYTFKKLRFCFEPTLPTSSPGSIAMCFDYDSADAPPLNKQELLAQSASIRSNVWMPCCLDVDARALHFPYSKRYTLVGEIPSGTDVRLYDVGRLTVANCDLPGTTSAGTIVGELWVEYEVDLLTPQLNTSGELYGNTAIIDGGSISDPLYPMGTAPVITGGAPVVVGDGGDLLTFKKPGQYLITAYLSGTTLVNLVKTATGNAVVDNAIYELISGAATSMVSNFVVRTFSPYAGVVLAAGAATLATSRFSVSPVAQAIWN